MKQHQEYVDRLVSEFDAAIREYLSTVPTAESSSSAVTGQPFWTTRKGVRFLAVDPQHMVECGTIRPLYREDEMFLAEIVSHGLFHTLKTRLTGPGEQPVECLLIPAGDAIAQYPLVWPARWDDEDADGQ